MVDEPADVSAGLVEDLVRLLFDEAAEGLLILSETGHVTRRNEAAERFLGRRIPIDAHGADVLGDEIWQPAAARPRPPLPLMVTIPRPGFAPRLLRVAFTSIRPTAGLAGRLLLRLSDASADGSRTEVRTREEWAALGQRTSGIAHDMNNVLAVVIAATDAILARAVAQAAALGERTRDDLSVITAAAVRGRAMVRTMLSAMPSASAVTGSALPMLDLPMLDIDDAIRGLRGMLGYAGGARVKLAFELAAPRLLVAIEHATLERVLLNLVVNARDAMAEGGAITVRTVGLIQGPKAPAGLLAIEVCDTGPGITPDILARIGQPFFTTKPDGQGTGLGLATARTLLAEVGGLLTIHSVPGQGTRVRVELPVRAEAIASEPAGSPSLTASCPATRGTIVLVDDDEALLRLVARSLANRGWHVLPESSGEAALALLRGRAVGHLAALVTDLALPGLDGQELAGQVRTMCGRADLPAILVSGFTQNAQRQGSGRDSVSAFLAKPYELSDLAALLDRLVLPCGA